MIKNNEHDNKFYTKKAPTNKKYLDKIVYSWSSQTTQRVAIIKYDYYIKIIIIEDI